MTTPFELIDKNFIAEIKEIVSLARQKAYTAICITIDSFIIHSLKYSLHRGEY
ncbi:MAG: hypothetical protein WCQ55_03255 [Paludibacteraceae bacterium]